MVSNKIYMYNENNIQRNLNPIYHLTTLIALGLTEAKYPKIIWDGVDAAANFDVMGVC